jgi:serine/threonine-protein kinase
MKGKLAYMSPEQLMGSKVDRRADVFAAGIVLWETLAGKRLFDGNDQGEVVGAIVSAPIRAPSSVVASIPPALDSVVMCALSRDRDLRFQDARQFAIALEKAVAPATPRTVGEWVEAVVGGELARRAEKVGEIESISAQSDGPLVRMEGVSPQDRTETGLTQPKFSARSSSPSITTDVFAASRRRRRWGVSAFLLLLVLCATAGAMLAMRGFPLESAADAVSSPPAIEPVTPAAVVAPQAETQRDTKGLALDGSPAIPVAGPASAPESEPASKPPPMRRTRAASQRRWQAPTSPAPAPRPRAPATNDCNPPYIVDQGGIRRLKPQCL